MHSCYPELSNIHDPFAIKVMKAGAIVGHLPKNLFYLLIKDPLKWKIDLSLNVRLVIVKYICIDSSRPSHLLEVLQAIETCCGLCQKYASHI